ncbi:hypothetical protein BDB00DRAFT_543799 [Zychaea mexicana]|uniref:uncharacterized protein n=1 Tax=Zychaea mexicana TaxID=64656 RepID=UPI0022FE7047|nr:uncharacterized protein BDB00DRAFT_543799 [Zychaea mexicana]KAI9497874.1 hypothetical protein BDB00DRAFT_543799 [Zychaea mexicana]
MIDVLKYSPFIQANSHTVPSSAPSPAILRIPQHPYCLPKPRLLIMITENNSNLVLIKIAWLFMLLLVTATFAQQLQPDDNDGATTSTSSEPSAVSSSSLSSFAEPLSHVPEPNSGFGQDFQKAKLGFDALKVGKQHADRLEDKLPKVAYSG